MKSARAEPNRVHCSQERVKEIIVSWRAPAHQLQCHMRLMRRQLQHALQGPGGRLAQGSSKTYPTRACPAGSHLACRRSVTDFPCHIHTGDVTSSAAKWRSIYSNSIVGTEHCGDRTKLRDAGADERSTRAAAKKGGAMSCRTGAAQPPSRCARHFHAADSALDRCAARLLHLIAGMCHSALTGLGRYKGVTLYIAGKHGDGLHRRRILTYTRQLPIHRAGSWPL